MRYKDFDEPHSWYFNILLNFCMTFLCLGAPYAYLRHINEFFMSGVGRTDTITERWQAFVDENVVDWTNTNLVVSACIVCVDSFERVRMFSRNRRQCWLAHPLRC